MTIAFVKAGWSVQYYGDDSYCDYRGGERCTRSKCCMPVKRGDTFTVSMSNYYAYGYIPAKTLADSLSQDNMRQTYDPYTKKMSGEWLITGDVCAHSAS